VTIRRGGAFARHLDTLFSVGVTRELTDGQLLERFSTGRGKVAELAFEVLVERHGAMVLRVCRAQLADPNDSHDAFQATFLILVKKARSLWVRDSLGPWLHQVAFRTASCARLAAARRRKHEHRAAEMASAFDGPENPPAPDWEAILHEEINRLPERYRIPIVLCDLQGCTCEEAAQRLGRPVGTVKSWRARGRARLRDRLIRRGVAPSAALGVVLANDATRAMIPEQAIRLAGRVFSDGMTSEGVSASVHSLVKGVFKTMLLSKLQTTATTVFATVFLSTVVGSVAWVVADDTHKPADPAKPAPIPSPPAVADLPRGKSEPSNQPGETWSLTLQEAIRIGLDNADNVRVISFGKPSKIAPINPDVDPLKFKAETMALIRSIEQQYWSLAQVHTQVDATKKAVELAEEILKHERADLAGGKGTTADVAEAEQRLQQFNLDLITRTSDLATTERLLRNVLDLPPADGRRIVTVTPPIEAQLKPDWEVARAAMLENQPEILQAKARVKQAEAEEVGADSSQLTLSISRKAALEQILHHTTHALARFFLEIDSNYKQFKTASKLRAAALTRFQAQRAYYEEGRITIDRFLDAASQYCAAIASEAQFKTTYNISIVALEEAKGTLLEYEGITVVDGPRPSVAIATAATPPTVSVVPATPMPSHASATAPFPTAVTADKPSPSADPLKIDLPDGKTVTFDLTVGNGSSPIRIRGSFTVAPARKTR
jgi:RNA polymerase sigma factor (sigma-70 family)